MAAKRTTNDTGQGTSPFTFYDDEALSDDKETLAPEQQRASRGVDVADFKHQDARRFTLDRRLRISLLLLVAACVSIPVTMVLPVGLFGYAGFDSSLAQVGASFGGRIAAVSQIGSGTAAGQAMAIYFWQILAVAISGAALALNGAVYQGALKNALASPSTLGVMSGATLGSVIYTLGVLLPHAENSEHFQYVSQISAYYAGLSPIDYFVLMQSRFIASLIGCIAVVALVLVVAFFAGKGRISKVGLLVSGQVFTMVIASVIEMLHYYVREHGTEAQINALRIVVGGGFYEVTTGYQVLVIAIPVGIGIIIIMLMRSRLNLLTFTDDEAKVMGLNASLTRIFVVAVCTVLTAVIVSFAGEIGFVGFLVPHVARKIVGPDFRYFIPASVCLGAFYLVIAFYLMNLTGVMQGSLGTFTSLVGIVFFAFMAIRCRSRGNVDWI